MITKETIKKIMVMIPLVTFLLLTIINLFSDFEKVEAEEYPPDEYYHKSSFSVKEEIESVEEIIPSHDIEYYYSGITMSDEEYDIFCRTIETEVTGEGNYQSKLHVAEVILNRVKNSRFPNTIKDVCWAPGQFSYSLTPDRYHNLPISETTKQVVNDVFNVVYDDTNGALFFCSGSLSFDSWASYIFTDDVGHKFYKN